MTTLLEKLKPIKPLTSTSMELYKEDSDLFFSSLEILKNESKGSSEINEAVLFEHLVAQLRADQELMKKVESSPLRKRKKRTSKKKSKVITKDAAEKSSVVVQ